MSRLINQVTLASGVGIDPDFLPSDQAFAIVDGASSAGYALTIPAHTIIIGNVLKNVAAQEVELSHVNGSVSWLDLDKTTLLFAVVSQTNDTTEAPDVTVNAIRYPIIAQSDGSGISYWDLPYYYDYDPNDTSHDDVYGKMKFNNQVKLFANQVLIRSIDSSDGTPFNALEIEVYGTAGGETDLQLYSRAGTGWPRRLIAECTAGRTPAGSRPGRSAWKFDTVIAASLTTFGMTELAHVNANINSEGTGGCDLVGAVAPANPTDTVVYEMQVAGYATGDLSGKEFAFVGYVFGGGSGPEFFRSDLASWIENESYEFKATLYKTQDAMEAWATLTSSEGKSVFQKTRITGMDFTLPTSMKLAVDHHTGDVYTDGGMVCVAGRVTKAE